MSDTTHTISQKRARRRQTMKAFVVSRYGKANSVEAVELPEPELGDRDVLIQIHAASVNPLDLKIRNGELKPLLPYKLPLVLGNDLAGIVIKAGANVDRFKPGDEVYAKPDKDRIGAFAELIAVSENDVAKKPQRLDMEQAASIPLVGLTAWQALIEKAKVRPGQKVLIHAGSGGLGTIAIQLAKHLGATVATTTSTANVEWVKRSEPMSSSTTGVMTSKPSFAITTLSLTPKAVRHSRSPSGCSNPAEKSSRWPGRPSPISPKSSGRAGS